MFQCRYNSQWYRLSPKGQKILQFMTMRCAVPCQLTAGKMMIMSARNFWLVRWFILFINNSQKLEILK